MRGRAVDAASVEPAVLFSDDEVLAIAKPSGLATVPDRYDTARAHVRAMLEPRWGRVWLVHRLDRDASGVLVLARTAAAHRELNRQFEAREVDKTYLALVAGRPEWGERRIDAPLRPSGDRRHRTVVDPARGKESVTEVRVLESFTRHALIEARPATGRAHQIRAHLAWAGHPILADPLYGGPPAIEAAEGIIARLALHAVRLELRHPATGAPLVVEAPIADDFAAALATLSSSGRLGGAAR